MYHEAPARKFTKTKLLHYCATFTYGKKQPAYLSYGYLRPPDFMTIATWKSARPTPHYQKNNAAFIREVTSAAFAKDASEAFRIQALTMLHGVNYPVASALLHLAYDKTYPIIDFRVLWSLWGVDAKGIRYDAELWSRYVNTCRKLAKDNQMTVRDVEKALWQYSKKHQAA